MYRRIITSALISVLLAINLIPTVLAQGPFEMPCPRCRGTGKISTTNTCSICQGSGKTTVWETCTTCQGSGEIAPTITRKSMNGWGALVGFDWVARIQGVFHNEEDRGTYGKATSEVHTVTKTYYRTSSRTYFPPHEDVTITLDTSEVGVLTDWTYTIYISSKDDIQCPSCNGSGGESVIATCSECNGSGEVTAIQTCTVCNGRGYITNHTAVNLAIVGVVVIIGSVVGVAGYTLSRRNRKGQ